MMNRPGRMTSGSWYAGESSGFAFLLKTKELLKEESNDPGRESSSNGKREDSEQERGDGEKDEEVQHILSLGLVRRLLTCTMHHCQRSRYLAWIYHFISSFQVRRLRASFQGSCTTMSTRCCSSWIEERWRPG